MRYSNGYLEEGKQLVLGKNSKYMELTALDEKIIRIYQDAEFLKAVLKSTEKEWQTLKLSKLMKKERLNINGLKNRA